MCKPDVTHITLGTQPKTEDTTASYLTSPRLKEWNNEAVLTSGFYRYTLPVFTGTHFRFLQVPNYHIWSFNGFEYYTADLSR